MLVKVLRRIGDADSPPIVLDIYTMDRVTSRQRRALHDGIFGNLKGSASPEQLRQVYAEEADILLHVESMGLRHRYGTRYSVSTKVVDCMASGCAVMAICPEMQEGYRLLAQAGAIVASDEAALERVLREVASNPGTLQAVSGDIIRFGLQYLQGDIVQAGLRKDIESILGSCSDS
jgi:hypothetical protein